MKKIAIILACFALLVGCATVQQGPSVCEKPEAVGSFICKVCTEHGTTPEALNGILLDANAIAMIADLYNRNDALQVVKALEFGLSENPIQSYTNLIGLVFKESADARLAASIIARHIAWFQSPLIISTFDRGLITYHLQQQRMLLE